MNSIGYRNFRRFEAFDPIEYGGITFLVGRNNSGKSTIVKALLLIDHYFDSGVPDLFSFGNNILEDANIVTYGRAKYKKAKENFIEFFASYSEFSMRIKITGEDEDAAAKILELEISHNSGIIFHFDFQSDKIEIHTKESLDQENADSRRNIVISMTKINKRLKEIEDKKTSREYIELRTELERVKDQLKKSVEKFQKKSIEKYSIAENISDLNTQSSLYEIVESVCWESAIKYRDEFKKIQQGGKGSDDFVSLKYFYEFGFDKIYSEVFDSIEAFFDNNHYIYIGASNLKQSALFSIKDKNNALAQAIHEFAQFRITPGELEHRFLIKWMKRFEVGDDFIIKMHAGEAYEFKVISHDTLIDLADKGMGSIQIMVILLKIACTIKRNRVDYEPKLIQEYFVNPYRYTVIIEEPELSLHPQFQSMLTELFYEVHTEYAVNFIIETHSEYILRKSQVLVAEKELEIAPNVNPFHVIYIPHDIEQKPYKLNYQKDGVFDKNFGDGFFDVASSSTLELIKLRRQKNT
jgi:energy-coupling factor transporter ATP-binding protein EcfA2